MKDLNARTFETKHNNRFIIKGNSNQGTVAHNTNGSFNGSTNLLKLFHNTNGYFTASGSQLFVEHTTNANIKVDISEIDVEHGTNTKIVGERNKVTINKDTNLTLEGNNNKCLLEGNVGLSILGDGHQVTASGTVNHTLTKAPQGDMNRLTIKPNSNGLFAKFGLWNPQRTIINGIVVAFKVAVEYIDSIKIHQDEYEVGIFKFRMEQFTHDSNTSLRVTFDPVHYDKDTLRVLDNSSGTKCTLSGVRQGKKEVLEVVAPSISSHNEDGKTTLYVSKYRFKL